MQRAGEVVMVMLVNALLVGCTDGQPGSDAGNEPNHPGDGGLNTDAGWDGGSRTDGGGSTDAAVTCTWMECDGGARLEGVYRVVHHTLNSQECTSEGPDVTNDTDVRDGKGPYFRLTPAPGTEPIWGFAWCSDIDSCSPTLPFVYSMMVYAQTLSADKSAAATAVDGTQCHVEFFHTVFHVDVQHPGKVAIERTMKHALKNGTGLNEAACTEFAEQCPDADKQCGYFHAVSGERIDS